MKHSVIAIIGVGSVGATLAYVLMLRNIVAEIILVDRDTKRCEGELRDLSDALAFCTTSRIRQGTYADARHADIIIIAAGIPQKTGQKRTELLKANQGIVRSIMDELHPLNPSAIVIVITNPVDLMTYVVYKRAGLPKEQVIGSGTMLDSQRLRRFLSCRLTIAEESIEGYVLGEHGDAQCIPWSFVRVGGKPLHEFGLSAAERSSLEQAVKQEAYDIIAAKGATYYGIAACVATLCTMILFDTRQVVPLSMYHDEQGVCFSLPVVVGEHGIVQTIELAFTEHEKKDLITCIKELQEATKMLQ